MGLAHDMIWCHYMFSRARSAPWFQKRWYSLYRGWKGSVLWQCIHLSHSQTHERAYYEPDSDSAEACQIVDDGHAMLLQHVEHGYLEHQILKRTICTHWMLLMHSLLDALKGMDVSSCSGSVKRGLHLRDTLVCACRAAVRGSKP